jgi:NitT/TauT family transport system substrate-binding protein
MTMRLIHLPHAPLRGLCIGLSTALLAIACSPQDSAKTTKVLTVGTSAWPGYATHFVADAKGFFKAEGVEVKEIYFTSQSDSDAAFLAGKIDLNWTGLTGVVPQNSRDPSIKVIYQGDYSNGSDGIIARNIKTGADLKGKKIAREDILFEELLLRRYLEKMGASRKEVEVLSMTADAAATAFASGKIDVAVTYEPFMAKAAKEGKGQIVFTTKDSNIIPDGVIARAGLIKDHKPELQAYFRAIDKATQLVKSNAPEVKDIVAKKFGIPAAEVPAQLSGVKPYDLKDNKTIAFDPKNPMNLFDSLTFAAKTAKEMNSIPTLIDIKAALDTSIVDSL